MAESTVPSPAPLPAPLPPIAPFLAVEKLGGEARQQLLTALSDDSPLLLAFFRRPSLELVYLNRAGRRCLFPSPATPLDGLTLLDLVSLQFFKQLQREILPRLHAEGRWEGPCDLRDSTGGEHAVKATLSIPGTHRETTPFLCLEAQPCGSTRTRGDTGFSDRELLLALLEGSHDHIYFKDRASRFLRISRAQAQHFGLAQPEFAIGKTDFDFFANRHANPAFQDEQKIIRTRRPLLNLEEKETHEDGRITWVSTSKFPLVNGDGQVIGTFGISRDITTQKQADQARRDLELQLQAMQKGDSIGSLVNGIAEELQAPTHTVIDRTRQLLDLVRQLGELPTSSAEATDRAARQTRLLAEATPALLQNLEELERMAQLLHSVREFARPRAPEPQTVDLHQIIGTVLAVARHEWDPVAGVLTEFAPDLPRLAGHAEALHQVVLSLLLNACAAIVQAHKERGIQGQKGTITLRTHRTPPGIVLEIIDTGTGIPPEAREHIFDPGFTTKASGQHAGQSLAMVRNIVVQQHHGAMDFQTELGRGTTFRLHLPAAPLAP